MPQSERKIIDHGEWWISELRDDIIKNIRIDDDIDSRNVNKEELAISTTSNYRLHFQQVHQEQRKASIFSLVSTCTLRTL